MNEEFCNSYSKSPREHGLDQARSWIAQFFRGVEETFNTLPEGAAEGACLAAAVYAGSWVFFWKLFTIIFTIIGITLAWVYYRRMVMHKCKNWIQVIGLVNAVLTIVLFLVLGINVFGLKTPQFLWISNYIFILLLGFANLIICKICYKYKK